MLEIGRLSALLAALIKIVAKVLIGLIAVPAHVFRSYVRTPFTSRAAGPLLCVSGNVGVVGSRSLASPLGAEVLVLTLGDLELLKQLRAAGERGRNVRELNIRVTLDRLVKGGYLMGRPIDRNSVRYRITQRGQDAIVEHGL